MTIRLMQTCSLLLVLAAPALAQNDPRTFLGDEPGANFGHAVESAGDVNGDGFQDVIIGAQFTNHPSTPGLNDIGQARVHSGADGSALHTLYGLLPSDFYGHDVAGAGDVNDDGFADFIVGWWFDDTNGLNAGRAVVYSGPTGAVLHDKTGLFGDELFGNAVAGVGDLNNDGNAEFIVGAFNAQTINGAFSGQVRVFNGATGGTMTTINGDAGGDAFGVAVAGAGDTNNDGFPDIVVGAYLADANGTDSGLARVYSGQNFSVLDTHPGDAANDWFGDGVAGAGDVDNDGFDDVIVGGSSVGASFQGMARVYSGNTGLPLHTWTGAAANDSLGSDVDAAGDVDDDGFADVVYGISSDNTVMSPGGQGAGAAIVRSGQDGSILRSYFGDADGDSFGGSVAGAGDVNGDGKPDFLIGAFRNDQNGGNAGLARLYQECDGSLTSYGTSCAGSGGFAPQFTIEGCPAGGGTMQIAIKNGLGGSFAVITIGTAQAAFPFGAHCFIRTNPINILPIALPLSGALPGEGEITFNVTLPPVVAGTFTLQAICADRALGVKATTTNGVQIDFP